MKILMGCVIRMNAFEITSERLQDYFYRTGKESEDEVIVLISMEWVHVAFMVVANGSDCSVCNLATHLYVY